MRKFLYIAALSIVATLAFQSVATANYIGDDAIGGADCSGYAEIVDENSRNELFFLPDAGGCIDVGGAGTFGPIVNTLNDVVFDADTSEQLGVAKDLDPDLSSGANSVTHQEICDDFDVSPRTPQEYYEQYANSGEQAILDPDSDGLACTSDDEAFLSGASENQYENGEDTGETLDEGNPCAGAVASESLQEELGLPESNLEIHLSFFPDVGGCAYLANSPQYPPLKFFGAPVYDPETGEALGLVKDLDPDLTSGDNRTTYQEFCGNFPVPENFPIATGYTAQEYHDQQANDKERAILDPDSDGLACTSDDEAFLSGDFGDYDETLFTQTWNGLITQIAEDGSESEFWVEADTMPISEMTDDLIGDVVGEVALVGLDCGGVWILAEAGEDSIVVEERITSGATENCVESVPITLTPQNGGTLEYYFLDVNGSVGEGVLTLRGVPGNEDDGRKPSEKMETLGITTLPDTGGASLLAALGGALLAVGVLAATLTRRTR